MIMPYLDFGDIAYLNVYVYMKDVQNSKVTPSIEPSPYQHDVYPSTCDTSTIGYGDGVQTSLTSVAMQSGQSGVLDKDHVIWPGKD